jgi:hypothetical protein
MKSLLIITILSALYAISPRYSPFSLGTSSQMSLAQTSEVASKQVAIRVSLLSKEEKLPLLGTLPQTNPDVGFASIFLNLENHQEQNQIITIQNIEIRNKSDRYLQAFPFQLQKIELKPLENSVIAIHLTNKIGYVGQDQVLAIVSYQIGDRINIIESKAVEIDRH